MKMKKMNRVWGGGLECDRGYFLSLTLREMHLRDCDEECDDSDDGEEEDDDDDDDDDR